MLNGTSKSNLYNGINRPIVQKLIDEKKEYYDKLIEKIPTTDALYWLTHGPITQVKTDVSVKKKYWWKCRSRNSSTNIVHNMDHGSLKAAKRNDIDVAAFCSS